MDVRNRRHVLHVGAFAFWIIITIIPILGIILSIASPYSFYDTRDDFRRFSDTFGVWAPLAFIGLQVLQVVVTPLSHYSVGYMGGFLFGPVWGGMYNYIGRIIGHIAAFWLARTIGAPIVRKFVPDKTYEKYDRLVAKHPAVLFLIYFLPLFPDDEISYLVGISRMRFGLFLLANVFGHVGGAVSLAYLGAGINTKDPVFWILFVGTLAGFPVLWWLSRRTGNPTASSAEDGSRNE